MISLHKATDASGFANMQHVAQQTSKTFRNAAASTGMFEVQQMRLNSATDEYVKKLNAQKMSFRAMAKQRKIANAAYKEQLALENMTIHQGVGGTRTNKGLYDTLTPIRASKDLDTMGKRLAFLNAELKSGAHQMVNWGKNTQWAGRQLMVGFTMPIAAFGAAAGVMAYQIDKELTRVAKVYDVTAKDAAGVEKELAQVRVDSLKTAEKAAREYGQAATDTLQVQAELAATGKTGADLQNSTNEVMRIARLGEIEHQTAIDATIALQTVFRQSNQELTESFDYMNSVENATSLSTADFATAIPVAGAAVKEFGGDVKELGILLTAMKENGIGASEGANALKATMQRLSRPSKQIREEWAALTGTDITKLVDDSNNLSEVFSKINAVTENLDDNKRRKAFAGLFGSYQVTRMMALTKGMGDLENGVGQVSRAYEVAQQDATEWAATAEEEIARYRNSISGQWDVAISQMKLSLQEVGEPFLVVATKVVKGVTAIVKAFNGLPHGVKVMAALVLGGTALAGAVLMLTGLAANLTGSLLKVVGTVAGLALKMNILDKETKAQTLATELQTHGFMEQTGQVQKLTQEITAMTAALQEAALAQVTLAAPAMNIPQNASTTHRVNRMASEVQFGNLQKSFGDIDPELARQRASAMYYDEALAMDRHITAEKRAQVGIQDEQNKATAKRNNMVRAGVGLMALESAAMAASMFSSNEMVDKGAQLLMVAGMTAPAMAMAASGAKKLVTHVSDARKATAATAGGAHKMGRSWGGAARGVGAMGKAIYGFLGPIGIATAALTVTAGILYKNYKKHEEQRKQAIKDHKTLNNLAKSMADETGRAWKDFQKLNYARQTEAAKDTSQVAKAREYYDTTDSGKKAVKAYEDSDADKALYLQQLFIDGQVHLGMSSQEAANQVRGLMIAAGESYLDADMRAKELLSTLGEINSNDWADIMAAQAKGLYDNAFNIVQDNWLWGTDELYDVETAEKVAKDSADRIVGSFSQAMVTAGGDEAKVKAAFAQFKQTALVGWQGVWDDVVLENEQVAKNLKKMGIENAEQLSVYYDSLSDDDKRKFYFDAGLSGDALVSFRRGAESAEAITHALLKAYGAANGLGDGVTNVNHLLEDANLLAASLTFKEKQEEVAGLRAELARIPVMRAIPGFDAKASEEAIRVKVNAMSAAEGFKQGATASQAIAYFLAKTPAPTDDLKNSLRAAKAEASGLSRVLANLSSETIVSGVRAAMEGIQQDYADFRTEKMEKRQENERENAEAYWDGQKDALSDRLDRESDALDNAWEGKRKGLEAYWDARIEGVEKAIKAEQKAEEARVAMFEAEIARINRLADMANTTIDFNVALNEGNLDEAAKIANNVQAKDTEFIFNREKDRGSKKSDKRIDRLESSKEGLEKQKDAAIEAFDKREERAKKFFDNYRKMEEDSLEKSAEADMEAKEKRWKREKKSLDKVLDAFLAFAPKNAKQLKKHMDNLGLSMDGFGTKVDGKAVTWGQFISKRMHEGIVSAGEKAANDAMWNRLGKKGVEELIVALGFSGMQGWNHFMKTGEMKQFNEKKGQSLEDIKKGSPEYYHTGGWIGGDGTNRAGVAKTFHGTHATEKIINARKGEFMVNERAASKHGPLLEAMNNGSDVMGGAGTGPMGLMSAMVAKMFMTGFAKNVETKAMTQAATAPGYGPWSGQSIPTAYSLPGTKPWVSEAAAYLGGKFGITSIGGVGDRSNNPTSDHPRGLAIDFMTTNVAKGWALAAEALRLKNVLDATYMIWQKKIHSFDSRGWRPYSHPSGASNPTLDHMDHVHMSFSPNGKAGDLPTTSATGKTIMGPGGSAHPTGGVGRVGTNLHGSPAAIDISLGTGNKVYAVRSGTVTGSYDIPGYEPRARHGGNGYRSYGRVVTLAHAGGGSSLYAHLSQRSVSAGQKVTGGTVLGLSGDTGYSTGPHLHFGATPGPSAYLRKGTEYVKFDNTPAVLHRGESVLTKNLTAKMHEGVDRFANGGDSQYNVVVNINGYDKDKGELADEVIRRMKREAGRQPQSRSVGGRS